jgi:hypothetical protein
MSQRIRETMTCGSARIDSERNHTVKYRIESILLEMWYHAK